MVNGRSSVELKRAGSRVLDGCPAESTGGNSSNALHAPGRAPSIKAKASSLASSLINSLGGDSNNSTCSSTVTSPAGQSHSSSTSRPASPGMPSYSNPPSGSLLKSKSKDFSSVTWAGATSNAAPAATAAASLTDPGSASPFSRASRGNSIASLRPLLPDAVFVPENAAYGPLPHKHSSGCSVMFLPDHVFLEEASSTEAVCSDTEDGHLMPTELLRSNTGNLIVGTGSSKKHLSGLPANTGPPSATQDHSCAAGAGSSLVGGSNDGVTRQKSKVSFFLDVSTSGDAQPSTPRQNNSSNPGTGVNNKAGSRPESANSNARVVTWQACPQGPSPDSSDDEDACGMAPYKRCHTIALGELKSTEVSSCPGQINRPNNAKSSLAAVFGKLTVAVDGQAAPRRADVETPGTQALHYKQHHGYLPSRANSFAGNGLLPIKGTERSALSQGGSNKSSPGGANTDDGDNGGLDEESLLPALPPGIVPTFGSTAGTSTSSTTGSRVGGASAIAAAAAGADQQLLATAGGLSAHAAASLPPTACTSKHQLLVPNISKADRAASGHTSSSIQHQQEGHSSGCQQQQQQQCSPQVPKTLALAPANTPEPVLLAVSPRIPPNLQRHRWCLADFVLHKKLYDGYASTIYKAMDRQSGTTVALKLYHMSKLNSISNHQVAREVRLHIGLDHENIISLYAAFQESGSVVLVQEYAGGGDLWSYIDTNSGRLTERVTVSLVLQPFLKALQYLHFAGIIHRDIKPENVLFTSNMVLKVADFGLAVSVREERAVTRVGTLDYMAPEVLRCPLKRNPGDNKDRAELHYSQAVDAWAVGILAFELMTGRAPFSASGASDAAIESAIQTVAPSFPSRMSDPAVAFMTAALHKNPGQRPNILQLLQHPWIRSYQRSSSNGRAEGISDSGLLSYKHGTHPPNMLQKLVSSISRKGLSVNFDDSGMTGYGSGSR